VFTYFQWVILHLDERSASRTLDMQLSVQPVFRPRPKDTDPSEGLNERESPDME
jgi:hypothetical protein